MNLNAKDLSLAAMRQSDLLREAEERRLVREVTRPTKAASQQRQAAAPVEVDALTVRLRSAT